jgi:hypothetical protein
MNKTITITAVVTPGATPICGNHVCEAGESLSNCAIDCQPGAPPAGGLCTVENAAVPLGYRTATQYCPPTGTMKNQLGVDITCGNNYECKSNLCSNGKCTEVREVLALIPRIWCWLKSWIENPVDKEARQTGICSCEEDWGKASEDFC